MDDIQQRLRDSVYAESPSGKQATLGSLLLEILTVLKHMDSAERRGDVSSAKITLQRGTVDIAVHAYVGSDIQEAEENALASYRRILAALNQEGVDNFARTLEAVKR